MGNIAQQFATAFRDFVTDGVASSGPHDPIKEEVRAIGPLIEAALGVVSLSSVDVIKDTRANLGADLAHPVDAVALVYGDATDANNDLYIKVGASGSGSWTLTTILHGIIGSLFEEALALAEGFADDAAAQRTLATEQATLAENWAQSILTAEGGQIVTQLTDPVPANGTVEVLLTPQGSQVWQVVSGAWSFVDWLHRAPDTEITTSIPNAATALTNIRLVPFRIRRTTILNRVDITITTAATNATLFEVGIYSESYARLATAGVREATPVGRQTITFPDTAVNPGVYFFGIATNSAQLQIAVNDYAGGQTATNAFPLPSTAASPALTAQAPSVTMKEKGLPPVVWDRPQPAPAVGPEHRNIQHGRVSRWRCHLRRQNDRTPRCAYHRRRHLRSDRQWWQDLRPDQQNDTPCLQRSYRYGDMD